MGALHDPELHPVALRVIGRTSPEEVKIAIAVNISRIGVPLRSHQFDCRAVWIRHAHAAGNITERLVVGIQIFPEHRLQGTIEVKVANRHWRGHDVPAAGIHNDDVADRALSDHSVCKVHARGLRHQNRITGVSTAAGIGIARHEQHLVNSAREKRS